MSQLSELTPQQLSGLVMDLEQTIKVCQVQFEALATGLKRFEQTLKAMTDTHNAKSDEILVPMTASVYQEGTLVDKERFVVDVGAGYYIERGYEAQKVYLQKRIAQIAASMKQMSGVMRDRKMMLEQSRMVLQKKIGEMQQQAPVKSS